MGRDKQRGMDGGGRLESPTNQRGTLGRHTLLLQSSAKGYSGRNDGSSVAYGNDSLTGTREYHPMPTTQPD